jgi:hypothetical protein
MGIVRKRCFPLKPSNADVGRERHGALQEKETKIILRRAKDTAHPTMVELNDMPCHQFNLPRLLLAGPRA